MEIKLLVALGYSIVLQAAILGKLNLILEEKPLFSLLYLLNLVLMCLL